MLSLAERCAVGRATGLMLAVASGSGGPSAEPAPETEIKGSGERPLAEAAALEIACQPSPSEASTLGWLYQLPLQAAAWGQLHRCFQG